MTQLRQLLIDVNSQDSETRKKAFEELNKEHHLSLREIARTIGWTFSRVQRQFSSLGIECLSKADIQRHLLQSGKVKHPTEGTERSQELKDRIGEKVAKDWIENKERQENVSAAQRKRWAEMDETEKQLQLSKASDGIRDAAKNGSKLQNFLHEHLTGHSFVNTKNKTAVLPNGNLDFDLFIPEIRTVVEVDGVSHFEPVWGKETLQKNKQRDKQKAGLAMNYGYFFIRVKQTKSYSHHYASQLLILLVDLLKRIREKEVKELYHEISL